MSAVIETFLMCDGGCGAVYGTDARTLSAKYHRSHMYADGWRRIKGSDYCPDCIKGIHREEISRPNHYVEEK